ncbi:hypothetical protein KUTeg_014376 [Tegillarca granosa]|uniref:Transcription factor CBF/NF-Y/archaeal histone domain-containing protein n=1 Tax=Tegillarca granosa TaxID=220873 RepID=A0ABQ9EWF9_TEGGR|nr:hypothetical protein KUTeg_014376 [Tegillarca granosa]
MIPIPRNNKMPSKRKKYSARFPPARIKKIMQTDEEVGKVAAAVPVVICILSRALELFIESLIIKAGETTMSRNAKTLTTTHIKQTIQAEKKFDFLSDLVASVPDHQAEEDSESSQHGDQKKQKAPRQKRQKGEPGKRGRRKNNSGSSDEETEDNNDTNDDDENTETDEEQSHDSCFKGDYSTTEVFHQGSSNSVSEEPLNLCSNRGPAEVYQHPVLPGTIPGSVPGPVPFGMLNPYKDMCYPTPHNPERHNNVTTTGALGYYNTPHNSSMIPGYGGIPTNMTKLETNTVDNKQILNLSSGDGTLSSDKLVPPMLNPLNNASSSFGPTFTAMKSPTQPTDLSKTKSFPGISGGIPVSGMKKEEDDDYDS